MTLRTRRIFASALAALGFIPFMVGALFTVAAEALAGEAFDHLQPYKGLYAILDAAAGWRKRRAAKPINDRSVKESRL